MKTKKELYKLIAKQGDCDHVSCGECSLNCELIKKRLLKIGAMAILRANKNNDEGVHDYLLSMISSQENVTSFTITEKAYKQLLKEMNVLDEETFTSFHGIPFVVMDNSGSVIIRPYLNLKKYKVKITEGNNKSYIYVINAPTEKLALKAVKDELTRKDFILDIYNKQYTYEIISENVENLKEIELITKWVSMLQEYNRKKGDIK